MELTKHSPPHVRIQDRVSTFSIDVLIAILAVYAMSYYYYGMRVVMLGFYSVITCIILDMFCVKLAGKSINPKDMSPVITGLIIVLFMPASISVVAVVTAATFAMVVAKHPFGGLGENIFNPAAAGIAFTIICWPTEMFSYPAPLTQLPLDFVVEFRSVVTTIRTLKLGGIPVLNYNEMLFGNFAGALGGTCILVLVSCLLYLLIRKTTHILTSGSYLLSCALIAVIFPRNDMEMIQSLAYELMSGTLLLGAVFLLSDPVTSPKLKLSRFIYGFSTGVVVMIFRHHGSFDDGVVFAILLSNSFVWMIDQYSLQIMRKWRRREKNETAKTKKLSK